MINDCSRLRPRIPITSSSTSWRYPSSAQPIAVTRAVVLTWPRRGTSCRWRRALSTGSGSHRMSTSARRSTTSSSDAQTRDTSHHLRHCGNRHPAHSQALRRKVAKAVRPHPKLGYAQLDGDTLVMRERRW